MSRLYIAQLENFEKLIDNFLKKFIEDERVVLLNDRSLIRDVEAAIGTIRNDIYILMLKIERLKLEEK
jgi:Txe/YoeB family toxin of Txe-Axe toxin-antitoxin module